MDLRPFIRDVPDFPKPGIVFKDITPLLRSPEALEYTSHALAEPFKDAGVTAVVAVESRGLPRVFLQDREVPDLQDAGTLAVQRRDLAGA